MLTIADAKRGCDQGIVWAGGDDIDDGAPNGHKGVTLHHTLGNEHTYVLLNVWDSNSMTRGRRMALEVQALNRRNGDVDRISHGREWVSARW